MNCCYYCYRTKDTAVRNRTLMTTELGTLIVGILIMLLGLLLAWGSGRSLWAYVLVAS